MKTKILLSIVGILVLLSSPASAANIVSEVVGSEAPAAASASLEIVQLGTGVLDPIVASTGVESEEAQASAPGNSIFVDVTINPQTGEMSIGGYSANTLRAFGIYPIHGTYRGYLSPFQFFHLQANGSEIKFNVDDIPIVDVRWDNDSRRTLLGMAASYGLPFNGTTETRVEEWFKNTNVDLMARVSNETSKPMVIDMATLVQVDVGANGELSVESLPLAARLNPELINVARRGEISNSTVCWSKGTVVSKVNGNSLPSVTLHKEGLDVLSRAANIEFENMEPFFLSQLGLDVSFDGGEHSAGADCED